MKKVRLCLLILPILLLAMTVALAQENEKFILNEANNSAAGKANIAPGDKIYYSLNEEMFRHENFKKGAEIELYVGDGEPKELVLMEKKEYFAGKTSIIAREKGQKENLFIVTYSNGRLNGQFHESHKNTIFFGFENETGQNFLSKSPHLEEGELACGIHYGEERFIAPAVVGHWAGFKKNKAKAASYEYSPAPLNASIDDSITIDVMLVYTNAAQTWASSSMHGDIDAVLAQALTLSQAALDNSELNLEIRLVHTHKTDYDEINDGEDTEVRLRRLTQNPDNRVFTDSKYDGHMEEIHPLRDEHGADVVSLIANINDTGGLGWVLSSTGGSPIYAFNVNRVQQIANGYTLIHEIGHNMGNVHARTQNDSPANGGGGLFLYSTGYQDQDNDFHTIMSYADGLGEAPLFSSPDLIWNGVPAGTNNNETPENNALSMGQIKRTIALYRPTILDAPEAVLSTNEIEAEMNREDNLGVTFEISNNGESNLVWDIDFDFLPQSVEKEAESAESRSKIKPVKQENPLRYPANYSGNPNKTKTASAEQVIFNTSFETSEGFGTGSHEGRAEWRANANAQFIISSDNPRTGNLHMRLEFDGGDTQFISSPFFGYQPFGSYEVTINFSLSGSNYDQETFDFYIYDGKTGDFSSGVIISQGRIFAADLDEGGEISFFSTQAFPPADVYRTLRILYNTESRTIDYFYGGTLIAQNSYLNGFAPGLIRVLHRNNVSGTHMDVDDIQIKQIEAPHEWLSVPDMSGFTLEGESGEIGLNFNSRGVAAGTYETLLKVRTNDPNNSVMEVPITLTVRDEVSNEISEMPQKITLEQNYPNPFNPSTTIKYTLADAEHVLLEVFSIQGKKVATLQNERKPAGAHEISFDASNLSSGIYMYRLKTGAKTITRQMVLIK